MHRARVQELSERGRMSILIMSFAVESMRASSLRGIFNRIRVFSGLEMTISKLIGQSLGARHITKDHWLWQSDHPSRARHQVTLSRLTTGSSVATVIREISVEELTNKEIKSTIAETRRELFEELGLKVISENVVYPVLVILSKAHDVPKFVAGLQVELTKSSDDFKVELMRQICHRVGIERSLLNWAQTGGSKKGLQLLFWTPYSAFRVGHFPVEIMADSVDVIDKLDRLRAEFNLHRVRNSVLARARTWWTVTSVIVALIIFTLDLGLRIANIIN